MNGHDPRKPDEAMTSPEDVDPRIGAAAEAEADEISDPANDERIGHDWSAEGGATPEGPATAVPEDGATASRARSTQERPR